MQAALNSTVDMRPRAGRSLLERQRAVLEMIVRGEPLATVLGELCLALEAEADGGVRAAILRVDPVRRCLVKGAAPSLPEAYNDALDGVPIVAGVATCCDAAARGVRVITPDIAGDPGWAPFAHLPLALGLKGCWSMPVFSALWGYAAFGERLAWRQLAGVAAAGLGVMLLLWSEFSSMSGAPLAALALLGAACIWALGTHQLRRASLEVPLLTAVLWMTSGTTVLMVVLSVLFERAQWRMPEGPVAWAIAYNAVGVFGFAHAAWFYLARSLPPVASSISVMLIPVLGTFSGAWALGEALHWQDFAAMLLMVLAIAAVLFKR